MDKQREKLIALINNAPKIPCIMGGRATGKNFQTTQNIADHLLADEEIKHAFELLKAEKEGRLIVPPCKVEDKVYKINTAFNYVMECKVVGFHLGKFPTLRGTKRDEYLVCYSDYHLYHLPFDKIGKTIFFSKEEAEKALKVLKAVE